MPGGYSHLLKPDNHRVTKSPRSHSITALAESPKSPYQLTAPGMNGAFRVFPIYISLSIVPLKLQIYEVKSHIVFSTHI